MNIGAERYLRLTNLLTAWRSSSREEIARTSRLAPDPTLSDLTVMIGRSGGARCVWTIEASGAEVDALYAAPLSGEHANRLTPGRDDAVREIEIALETGRPLLLEDTITVARRPRRIARLYLPFPARDDANARVVCGVVPVA